MGVNVILTKIWSGAASKTHPVGRKFSPSESIRYHLVAFRHLSTINAELIYHTYANGPSIAIIGIIPDRNVENELCAIHGTFLSQAPTLCQYGERSVWTDKANDITVFIEIFHEWDTERGCNEKILNLVHGYTYTRNRQGERIDTQVRMREINFYVCEVFFYHWFQRTLDGIGNPNFSVEAIASGNRALQKIARFIKDKQWGGFQNYRKICSSSLSPHQREIVGGKFNFHYAIFESFRTRDLKISRHSYQTASMPGRFGLDLQDDLLTNLLLQITRNKCHFGQKSIWEFRKDEAAERVVIFIEIVDPQDAALASRLSAMKVLLDEYSDAIRKMPGNMHNDIEFADENLEREIRNYFNMVFCNHWIKEDLDGVLDPHDGVLTSFARAMVALAFGCEARDHLQLFVEFAENMDC